MGRSEVAFSTIADVLDHYAKTRPDASAIVDFRSDVSFGELRDLVDRVASALVHEGLVPGDRVALLDLNSRETVELLIAGAKAGTVLVPINSRLQSREVATVLLASTPRVFVVHRDLYGIARAAVDESGLDLRLLVIDSAGGGDESYESWRDSAPPASSFPGPSDTICICHTSGTTAGPKGVMVPQSALVLYWPELVTEWRMDAASVNVVALPLFNIGGLSWWSAGFVAGARTILLRTAEAGGIMDAFETYGGTHINVVSTILQLMLQAQRERARDVSTIRLVTCGGSPLRVAHLREAWHTFGCEVRAFYGLSEAGGGVSQHLLEQRYADGEHPERLRSAGLPFPGVSIRILDVDSGAPVEPGGEGEIVVSGSAMMVGYWQNPEATGETLTADGWLRTGDVGRIDEHGYLYILERLKDVIISGGANIYASEVEDAIASAPGVLEAAVIGVPHEKWGETPRALVVARPGEAVEEDAVIAWTRDRLAHYKCPTQVVVVDALPKTPTGKIDKKVLRAQVTTQPA